MFRILGFIIGSAISIAAILLLLGVPQFHLSTFETDQARFDAALDKVREKKPVVERAVTELVDKVVNEFAENADQALAESPPVPATSSPESLPAEQAVSTALPTELPEAVIVDQRWYKFWNPFRSEIAAHGFVSQLEKVTGLDYRIIKIKAGVYQVEFAYATDDERRLKLSTISAATGLDLPQT